MVWNALTFNKNLIGHQNFVGLELGQNLHFIVDPVCHLGTDSAAEH